LGADACDLAAMTNVAAFIVAGTNFSIFVPPLSVFHVQLYEKL